jgi:hypothetical protein
MGNLLLGIGSLCGTVGIIWIAVIAFQKGDVLMGVLSLVCCGLVAIYYGATHLPETKVPLILVGVAVVANVLGSVFGGLPAIQN